MSKYDRHWLSLAQMGQWGDDKYGKLFTNVGAGGKKLVPCKSNQVRAFESGRCINLNGAAYLNMLRSGFDDALIRRILAMRGGASPMRRAVVPMRRRSVVPMRRRRSVVSKKKPVYLNRPCPPKKYPILITEKKCVDRAEFDKYRRSLRDDIRNFNAEIKGLKNVSPTFVKELQRLKSRKAPKARRRSRKASRKASRSKRKARKTKSPSWGLASLFRTPSKKKRRRRRRRRRRSKSKTPRSVSSSPLESLGVRTPSRRSSPSSDYDIL